METPDCAELISPYVPDRDTGLLHLPRFISKIRLHLRDALPRGYQRNFCRGFDGFLCLHLGWDPREIVELVRQYPDPEALQGKLRERFPEDCRPNVWNRKVVQMGMHGEARDELQEVKEEMGIGHRKDLISFADLIEFDEDRIE